MRRHTYKKIIEVHDRVDQYGKQTQGYVYFGKLEYAFGFYEEDKPFGFEWWQPMMDAYDKWRGGRFCDITKVVEPYSPGNNPARVGVDDITGIDYQWLQVDHKHHPDCTGTPPWPGGLLSIRGLIARGENEFLKMLEEPHRIHLLGNGEYYNYITDPPFQRFLREVDLKEYNKRLRELND